MTASNAQTLATKGIAITTFHKDVYACINTQHTAVTKATGTMQAKLGGLLVSKYGTVAPTFEQFRLDRMALKELAVQKGLADDQWLRKPFNAALIALFGKLPEAQTQAAIAKRKLRDAAAAKKGADKPKVGAVKGETAPRRNPEPETIEQLVARVGIWKVLEACTKILASDESTVAQAKTLASLKKAA